MNYFFLFFVGFISFLEMSQPHKHFIIVYLKIKEKRKRKREKMLIPRNNV